MPSSALSSCAQSCPVLTYPVLSFHQVSQFRPALSQSCPVLLCLCPDLSTPLHFCPVLICHSPALSSRLVQSLQSSCFSVPSFPAHLSQSCPVLMGQVLSFCVPVLTCPHLSISVLSSCFPVLPPVLMNVYQSRPVSCVPILPCPHGHIAVLSCPYVSSPSLCLCTLYMYIQSPAVSLCSQSCLYGLRREEVSAAGVT
jgi:hypothetical protein